jgi:hypothetical protein
MATTNQALLDEAISARHKLMTGGAVVKVTKDGMTVEYTRSTLPQLNAYIDELTTVSGGASKRRQPAGFRF